jgi:SAM-dependent methyltransferase
MHVQVYRGETHKSLERRLREGWFEKYAPADKAGLDIGSRDDPLNWTFRRWEIAFGDGDATDLEGVPPETYYTVYASHVLEHIQYHRKALKRWYEVLKPGGHLIICVPHALLYEKKRTLPSYWNQEHVRFWLPEEEEPPCTLSLKKEILAAIPNADIVEFRVLDDCYEAGGGPNDHPMGEYSIEAIVRKPGE